MNTHTIVNQFVIIIKGAGEMATGVAARLYRAGFHRLIMLEVGAPMAVRRMVSFCEAVYDGEREVEGILALRAESPGMINDVWSRGAIPVLVDPDWTALAVVSPAVSIDAVLAKRNLGTVMTEADTVIALGPGFTAGVDAHYVIETNRGHDLGRVLTTGSAEPNTGVPGSIGGYALERVLRAPEEGVVETTLEIGDSVKKNDVVCTVSGNEVRAQIDGVLRGMIRPGIVVKQGTKIGDVDPRGERGYCFSISEKARALGGSVLEVVCASLLGSV